MKAIKILAMIVCTTAALQSCSTVSDDLGLPQPTALVTVIPTGSDSFVLQLDNTTTLYPSNMKSSPYGDKEVRALVNYNEEPESEDKALKYVHVNWLDSIRTKLPVPTLDIEDDETYGCDPVEIINDWVTVAEDGYLTLRVRTLWGSPVARHELNLITGVNPENPYEMELRHNAHGDGLVDGSWGDALIAFNLNGLSRENGSDLKIKLNWQSFSGQKSTEFDLSLRPDKQEQGLDNIMYNRCVE